MLIRVLVFNNSSRIAGAIVLSVSAKAETGFFSEKGGRSTALALR
jgi:hypothetical protein